MERTAWDPEGVDILLDETGSLQPSEASGDVDLRALYKALVGARAIDLRLGRLGLPLWASSAGEEAALVPAGMCLRKGDWLYPSARDAAAVFARGVEASAVAEHILGLDSRPVLPGDLSVKGSEVGSACESLGLALVIASGHARAMSLTGDGNIVLASFGEGTTSTGAFHESMCLAASQNLPMVFVCKSQMWPEGAPAEAGTFGDSVAERANAYGLWTRRSDGADPLSSYLAIERACEHARSGKGPALVDIVCTQLAHDPPGHRDPVERLRRHLDSTGVWTKTFQDVIEAEVRGQLDKVCARWEEAQEIGS
jgi:pyruvate dehydrogenase E1 component alpha subunit